MKIAFFIIAVMIGVSGCASDQTPSDIAAFTKAPDVDTGNPSEHDGCEIKGSGAYNPCLNVTSNSAAAQPVAAKRQKVYEPWQCETGPQAMGPVLGAMLSGTLVDLQNYCLSIGYGPDGSRPSSPPKLNAVAATAGGQSCANPFGGGAAPAGQYICSDQGELQACQCSGGGCELIPTGSFLCTSPGAVIR